MIVFESETVNELSSKKLPSTFELYQINAFESILNDVSRVWSSTRLFSSTTSSDQQSDGCYEEGIREKILEASLPFVPEYGWSKECISKGAQSIGYPGVIHGMFTKGGGDLIHYLQTSSNSKLVEFLKRYQNETQDKPIPPAEFAERAIQQRLRMIGPYIGKWPQAIAIMSLPPNVPNSLATLLTMVDDICYYAGDRSVDYNWYLRRIGIAGVYKATELYMIQDKSEKFQDTWIFLNKRLHEAVQLHDLLIKSESGTQMAKDTVQSVFITARNILGLNWTR